jgi:hypothetical protein
VELMSENARKVDEEKVGQICFFKRKMKDDSARRKQREIASTLGSFTSLG